MIERIVEMLRPPEEASRPLSYAALSRFRAAFPVPEDYLEFVRIYGSGSISGFLWFLTPSNRNEQLDFEIRGRALAKVLAEIIGYGAPVIGSSGERGAELVRLVAWATTTNSDILFWNAIGAPAKWSIGAYDRGSDEIKLSNLNFEGYVSSLLRGYDPFGVFADSLLARTMVFVPDCS